MSRQPKRPHSRRAGAVISDALAARLVACVRVPELSAAQRDLLRERVLRRIGAVAPPGTFTIRAAESQWRRLSELVEIRVVRREAATGRQTVMFRLHPGAVVVAHGHTQEEECLVLEGEIEIGDHTLYRGDLHIARPGARHAPITTRTGALLWVTSEIPPAHFSPT
jgi:quercetin dioxygenase-like cupin family protein